MPNGFFATPTASFIVGYRYVAGILNVHVKDPIPGRGVVYAYEVPESVAVEFHNASSKGTFLNQRLRGKFPSVKHVFEDNGETWEVAL